MSEERLRDYKITNCDRICHPNTMSLNDLNSGYFNQRVVPYQMCNCLLQQVLYDVGKITEDASTGDKVNNNSTLPELIIQGFDEEQVWTGIQLQNKNKLEKWRWIFCIQNSKLSSYEKLSFSN